MRLQDSIENIAQELLSSQNLVLISCKILQTLWAGYGHICLVTAGSCDDANQSHRSLILKYVDAPAANGDRTPDEGHIRKILSYQIEQQFYTSMASELPKEIGIASLIASVASSGRSATAILMENLRTRFPIAGEKRAKLNEVQVFATIRWLAHFHGFWWARADELKRMKLCKPPLEYFHDTGVLELAGPSVWLNGGYTYLATRQVEYASLAEDKSSEWSMRLCTPARDQESIAELVAKILAPNLNSKSKAQLSDYTTLIHGDVKSENLFTTQDGNEVAFFDFQYVGLGFGVCDLAKLFTCSVPVHLLGDRFASSDVSAMEFGEERLLRFYLQELEMVSGKQYTWEIFRRHWETALIDWLRFQASWGFWGNTDWLEARGRAILADNEWNQWLVASA